MRFRISFFGPPRLVDASGATVQFPKKGLFLVAHLLLSNDAHVVTRERAAGLLWDEAQDKAQAAANLRQLLGRIRIRQMELGLDLLLIEGTHIRLDPAAAEVDVTQFERAVDAPDVVDIAKLGRLYAGDFMSGMETLGEDAEEWVRIHRSRLRSLFVETLARNIEGGLLREDQGVVTIGAQRLLSIDPYNEIAYRALIRTAATSRQYGRVRELFEACRSLLRADLGIEPSTATIVLVNEILPGQKPAAESVPAAPKAPQPVVRNLAGGGVPRVTILPPYAPPEAASSTRALATSLLEDVTIGLCSTRAFGLVAPHTAWRIQRQGVPGTLLDRYKITYVVESQLVGEGNAPVLFVKLFGAQDRGIVWADRYEFGALAVAGQYREIAQRIATSLTDRVEQAELERLKIDHHPTAYQHYLLGRLHLASMDLPSARRARKIFRESLKACPDFVPALAGVARTYQREWLLTARGDPELLSQAEAYAQRAIAVAPDDARGYRELGVSTIFSRRFDDSIDALRHAEASSPQYADLIADFADTLAHCSEPELSLEKIEKAIELNPLCPDPYWWTAAGANYHLERYDAALSCIAKMKDQTPAYRLAAMTWGMKGNRARARSYMLKAKAEHPDFRTEQWLSVIPLRAEWQVRHYESGLRAAGFV